MNLLQTLKWVLPVLTLLASCTEREVNELNDGVIRLGVSTDFTTRAAINDFTTLSAEGTKVGVYGVKTATETATTPLGSLWTTGMLMQNVQTTAIGTDGIMSWANIYKYPSADETSKYVKFCLYYPYAGEAASGSGDYVTSATSGSAPVLHFTTDGSKDVMYTTAVTGSRLSPASEVTFKHALTQLSFELKDEDGLFPFPITGVKLMGVNTRAQINIETGALANWNTPGSVDLSSTSITLQAGKPEPLGAVVMLQPEVASYDLEVTYTDGTIKVKTAKVTPVDESTNTFVAGKAYKITINFRGSRPIELTAKLTPWQAGGKGEAIVE